MKFIITGSTGNISKPLASNLLNAGHEVTVITSDDSKASAIEQTGARAAVGTVHDVDFLIEVFTGADAVYTMVPPDFSATDYRSYIAGIGNNYVSAIKKSGIKRVVNLSSVGAHLPDGTGPVKGIYDVEQALNSLEDVSVLHVRPGFFYTNFYAQINLIKEADIMGSNYGEHALMVLVHPVDIAEAITASLQEPFKGKSVRYVASDLRTTDEIAKIIGEAIGKPALPWVNFTDEQSLDGLLKAGLPPEIAGNYTEMGAAVRSGKMFEEFMKQKPQLSKIRLEQFAKEFAKSYNP
ncbi:MAG: NAD-dependent epimerase/dehydratase family protein [Chitinophagaceae bacterium]|nr:MAG: NAD-dependent epimerase/dehydratase family protein [Chitinophagaceae bacterium]